MNNFIKKQELTQDVKLDSELGFGHEIENAQDLKMKNLFDIVVAVAGLIVFSPAILLIYIAIKLEDGGPAIFKQARIGYGGKEFILYKFRSMNLMSESDGKPALCQKDDDRLTKVGKFIRNHHLDEFPQLWNVLKGDMSIVGYRPERKYFVDKIMKLNKQYSELYKMRPGLFSLATLYNGYTDNMEKMLERLRMDLEYCHRRTMWLDIKIIYLTSMSIITGKKF